MKDFLTLILTNITTHPEAVVIDTGEEDGYEVYTLTVDPEDMGRVIGKDGKVIKAIRSLAHVVAIRQNKRVRIKLNDAGQPGAPEATAAPAKTPEKETPVKDQPEGEDLIAGAIDLTQDQPKS
ncbi:hypothetical protein A2W24_04710 [Microgenomates group bacterium RBG_16_45_19]|nr:MAG: hypothetical protein A2W24_04710 [Microgenomates group bacterium RBG_16_45_19]